ncbi:MAG: 50S ribosomal protein L19 [Candidatus Omnitrophota bacterium]
MSDKLKAIKESQLKKDEPKFRVGDKVKVHVKIVEEGKSRTQIFEGTVIARHSSGPSATFTVRKVSYGEGVERIFPVHSPNVKKVEIIKEGDVRRAKLFYLRKNKQA